MRTSIVVGIILLLAPFICAAAGESPKVTLDAGDLPIEQAMVDVARQAGVQILCDPALKTTVTGHFTSIELDALMDSITKINDLKWQKLYLPSQPDQPWTFDKVKARADAMASVSMGTVIMLDPSTGKQKVFVVQDPASPAVAPDKLGLKAYYIVYKPIVETKTAAKTGDAQQDALTRFKSIENERTKLLAQMTPSERIAALQQEMLSLLNLDPSLSRQIMQDQFMARNNLDQQSRDRYRALMHDTFHSMRDQGLITGDGPRGPRGGGEDRRGRDRNN